MRGEVRRVRLAFVVAVSVVVAELAAGAAPEAPAVKAPAEQKTYVGKSPAACETIDYSCKPGWKAFRDAQGCGCIPPPSPPPPAK
jgi:hypothetical protein